MKFDITQRLPGVDRAIARTSNKRHLAILENFRRHSILEVCGLWEGILAPDMMVPHPVYRFHSPKETRIIDGMEAVRAEYQSYLNQRSTVIYHTDEYVAPCDEGLFAEYVAHRFYPGEVLAKMGDAIDDPSATYLVSLTQAMFWPFDEQARVIEERVYRGNDRKVRRCDPDEVITVEECREKLVPLLRPVMSPF